MKKLASRVITILLQSYCATLLFCVAGAVTAASAANKANSETNRACSGMILDLGEINDYVQVTPEYSNAVLKAVLPYFSGVAKKLDLPVPQPVTQADVADFRALPFREMTASVRLKDGAAFSFCFGFVNGYLSPGSVNYFPQKPDTVSDPKHRHAITRDEAVQVARDVIKRLGISLEDVFAEQKPHVAIRTKYADTNAVPHCEIQWLDPRLDGQAIDNPDPKKEGMLGASAVEIQINGETKEVEKIRFRLLKSLRHPPPKIDVIPPDKEKGHDFFLSQIPPQNINPEYARQLVPMMFAAIDDYVRKLSLPVPLPLTTNNVARVRIVNNGGWPHCEIETTNGWRFIYRHTMVNGYYAPSNFYDSDDRKIHVRDFEGKWNLTTNQAIELVKTTLAKLNYPTNNIHMDFAPNIIYAAGDFKKIIPRYFFEWHYAINDEPQSKVEAEVNADSGKLESLYYDDKAYWGSRPPIDAPISIK